MKLIEAVIFDWAGTTVDYGCMAPVAAMQAAFASHDIHVPLDEIRKPMGLAKLDHIKSVLKTMHGDIVESQVNSIYKTFEEVIFAQLHQFTKLIPGLLDVQNFLRSKAIKIGTTTGYTQPMMNIVAEAAKTQGYLPDLIITPEQVKHGRPYPYMLQKNLMELEVQDTRKVVKVGDTIADIQEGLHAGCYSVGVVRGSSMLGLNENEIKTTDQTALTQRCEQVRQTMLESGAHFVIETIADLPPLLLSLKDKEHELR